MTEESLIALDIDTLLDVMVKSVNELLVMDKTLRNKSAIKSKQKELELIQKVIWGKKGAPSLFLRTVSLFSRPSLSMAYQFQ